MITCEDAQLRTVPQADCAAAVQSLLPAGTTMGRNLQVGDEGGCVEGGWGVVPHGCSAQSGGDWAPHFNTNGSTCPGNGYHLVCATGALQHTDALYTHLPVFGP